MHSQSNDGQQMHMNHHVAPEAVDNSSDCECGCSGVMDCSVSGCSSAALLNGAELKFKSFSQSAGQLVRSLAPSPDPHLLFRPPIFLS